MDIEYEPKTYEEEYDAVEAFCDKIRFTLAIARLERAIEMLENTDYEYISVQAIHTDGTEEQIIATMDFATAGLTDHIRSFLKKKLDDINNALGRKKP